VADDEAGVRGKVLEDGGYEVMKRRTENSALAGTGGHVDLPLPTCLALGRSLSDAWSAPRSYRWPLRRFTMLFAASS
jgi:hypothetical protein